MSTLSSASIAIIFIFMMMLPLVFASNLIYGLSQKIFVTLVACVHTVSVGGLYFRKDIYTYSGWTAVKDFDFTYSGLIDSYLPLWFFIITLLFFCVALNLCIRFFSKNRVALFNANILQVFKRVKTHYYIASNNSYLFPILIVGLLQVFASLIMLYNGAGIVGVVGDSLPYKIIGISYLFSKLLSPLALSYLFVKSNRSSLVYTFILLVALISGSAHLSRSTFLLTLLLPLLIILTAPKKLNLKVLSIFMLLFGLYHIDQERALVYSYLNEFRALSYVPISEWFSLFYKSFTDIYSYGFWEKSAVYFVEIISRLSSSQGIILGNQFNLDHVGGAFEIFKGIIYYEWQSIDHDAYGGGVLSLITALWFHNKLLFVVTALYISILFKTIDGLSKAFLKDGEYYTIASVLMLTVVLLIWIGTLVFYIIIMVFLSMYLLRRCRL